MRAINLIVIHCADTPASMDIGVEQIRKWHTQERGWSDIGYHYVVRRDGLIELGRDLDGDGDVDEEIGAHAFGYNRNSIGICMIGGRGDDGSAEDNFNAVQKQSLEFLVKDLYERYDGPSVVGHRDLDSGKQCPSFDVKSWWAEVNE